MDRIFVFLFASVTRGMGTVMMILAVIVFFTAASQGALLFASLGAYFYLLEYL